MKAIILVAGRGSRLGTLTAERPKCLAKVNGKTILENALQVLNKAQFDECIIVIGYKGNVVVNEIGHRYENIKITYIYNELYEASNTGYSLWLALQTIQMEKELFIFEGDVFFEQQLISEFLQDHHANATIIDKYNSLYDGSFVEINDQQNVIDWVHKNRRPPGFTLADKFKTVNIHKLSGAFIQNTLLPSLVNGNRSAPIEYVLQDIIKETKPGIFGFLSNGCKWFEIDTEEELLIANSIFK